MYIICSGICILSMCRYCPGYNRIGEIQAQDFLGWARNLDTLILRNHSVLVVEN
jgi:hypothetical protein